MAPEVRSKKRVRSIAAPIRRYRKELRRERSTPKRQNAVAKQGDGARPLRRLAPLASNARPGLAGPLGPRLSVGRLPDHVRPPAP